MNICQSFNFKISKNIFNECNEKDVADQINILNVSIFEDMKIDHIERLKRQFELLKFSEIKKLALPSAYILNLISQTNIQLGNLSAALDSSIKAKSKWEIVTSEEYGLAGLILCYSDIGQIYMKMGLIDESMGFFENGLNLLDDSDELFVAFFKIHYHLSEVYADLNFTSKAHEMINTCIERINSYTFKDENRKYIYLTPSLIILGNLYSKDNPTLAIEHYNKALKMCTNFNDVIYKQKIFYSLGIEYFKLKDLNRSEEYLLKAEKLYDNIKGDVRLINIKLGVR
jgi:tetratricopeptide (TPR) repeat protein